MTLEQRYLRKHVRLLHDVRTYGGLEFAAGTVMEVINVWRGQFDLEGPTNDGRRKGRIRRVHVSQIQLCEEL